MLEALYDQMMIEEYARRCYGQETREVQRKLAAITDQIITYAGQNATIHLPLDGILAQPLASELSMSHINRVRFELVGTERNQHLEIAVEGLLAKNTPQPSEHVTMYLHREIIFKHIDLWQQQLTEMLRTDE